MLFFCIFSNATRCAGERGPTRRPPCRLDAVLVELVGGAPRELDRLDADVKVVLDDEAERRCRHPLYIDASAMISAFHLERTISGREDWQLRDSNRQKWIFRLLGASTCSDPERAFGATASNGRPPIEHALPGSARRLAHMRHRPRSLRKEAKSSVLPTVFLL